MARPWTPWSLLFLSLSSKFLPRYPYPYPYSCSWDYYYRYCCSILSCSILFSKQPAAASRVLGSWVLASRDETIKWEMKTSSFFLLLPSLKATHLDSLAPVSGTILDLVVFSYSRGKKRGQARKRLSRESRTGSHRIRCSYLSLSLGKTTPFKSPVHLEII